MRTRPAGYTATAIALHWLVAALVAIQLATKLISGDEDTLNAWHLAIGPTILLLMLVRLAWRLRHPPPPPPADLAPPLRLAATVTHGSLYALLILIPLAGWVSASGWGVHPTLLGLVPLPALAAKNDATAHAWGAVHGTLAWLLVALAALHIAAVLYHVLAKDDGVPQRMISPVRSPAEPGSR